MLFYLLFSLLLLELLHDSAAQISDVLSRLEGNSQFLVYVLAVASQLLDEDLGGLLVDVVQRLLLVIHVGSGQLDLDGVVSAPAHRQTVRRL